MNTSTARHSLASVVTLRVFVCAENFFSLTCISFSDCCERASHRLLLALPRAYTEHNPCVLPAIRATLSHIALSCRTRTICFFLVDAVLGNQTIYPGRRTSAQAHAQCRFHLACWRLTHRSPRYAPAPRHSLHVNHRRCDGRFLAPVSSTDSFTGVSATCSTTPATGCSFVGTDLGV